MTLESKATLDLLTNSLTVRNSTISGNGFGVSQTYGSLLIEQTTIANNGGGGIFARSAQVDIRETTVAGNSGSGINLSSGTATIVGSTISGNGVVSISLFASASGGGILSTGNLTLRHCTITKNSVFADSMLPGSQAHGGGLFVSAGTAVLDHTIVAGNRATADISSGDDIQGPVSALSLISAVGRHNTNNGGNLIGANPILGTLADNGGPTMTHALLIGSPAIDAGDPSAVAGEGIVPQFDQRGDPFRRVFNGDGAGGADRHGGV